MATIQPWNTSVRPAQVQAERLAKLPDKNAYNEFVDSTLQNERFLAGAPEETKTLASMARVVARSISSADQPTKAQLLQSCLDAAIKGSAATTPGGPGVVLAQALSQALPSMKGDDVNFVVGNALDQIALKNKGTESAEYASQSLIAAHRVSNQPKVEKEILMSGLALITELAGVTEAAQPTILEPTPGEQKAASDFRRKYENLDCKTDDGLAQNGYAVKPSDLHGLPVVLLVRNPQTGQPEEKLGRIEANKDNPSAKEFKLQDQPQTIQTSDVLATTHLHWATTISTPEKLMSDLTKRKKIKDASDSFLRDYKNRGFTANDRSYDLKNAYELTGRTVAFLHQEKDGRLTRHEGTITGTDHVWNAKFNLEGQVGNYNTNDMVAIAYLDRRPTYDERW